MPEEEAVATPEPEVVPPPPPPPARKPEPAHEPWKQKTNGRKRSRLWRAVWIVATVLVVVLAVLLLLPSEPEGREEVSGKAEQEQVVAEDPATSEGETRAEGTETPVTETPVTTTPVEGEQVAVDTVEDDPAYCIIAGSFKHMANAIELQDQLKARGYSAEVMQTENRMYRVVVFSYHSKSEAERELIKIRSEPGMESVWLLVNE